MPLGTCNAHVELEQGSSEPEDPKPEKKRRGALCNWCKYQTHTDWSPRGWGQVIEASHQG